MNISLQLYSIKEEAAENFPSALKLTAKAGYGGVEFAGYHGIPPDKMKALLAQHNLSPVGSHVGLAALRDQFERELTYAVQVGCPLLVCPWADWDSRETVLKDAAMLEYRAKAAAAQGVKIGYHNHDHEFKKFDGEYAMDILLANAPSVWFEPDLYWIAYAGIEPLPYLEAHAHRVCAVHAKEIAADGKTNAYVGEGVIDFAACARLFDPEKIPYIVEQEEYSSDHRDGITRSAAGLRAVLARATKA